MKKKVSKPMLRYSGGILSQIFAMLMAALLVVFATRYIVLHPQYGSYGIDPATNAQSFEDTLAGRQIFYRDMSSLSLYLALCSQLETDGEYDENKKVNVFEYVNRKEKDAPKYDSYPTLIYTIGDLIEWGMYGIQYNVGEYYSEEDLMASDPELYDSPMSVYDAEMNVYRVYNLTEEFKPQNISSAKDLPLPEGMQFDEVINAIEHTSQDLRTNYDDYLEMKERFSSKNNVKFMFVSAEGEILYTNLENKENMDTTQLIRAFEETKTHLVYDYKENNFRSNNLIKSDETYYKAIFRNYSYCFPQNGTVYAALQTKSSSAFGPYNDAGFYATAEENFHNMNLPWQQILGFAGFFGLLALIALVMFIVCQPKKSREELKYFDRWFTEIAVMFVCATVCGIIAIGGAVASAFVHRDFVITTEPMLKGVFIAIYVTFTCTYALFLLYMGSLVRRIKAKALWKGSLCYWCLHNTKCICLKGMSLVVKLIDVLANNKSFMIRTFGPYCLFLVVNAFCLLLGPFGLVLMIVIDAAVAALLYYNNKARQEIVNGITRICDGDVDYQINTEKFYGENKVIAEAVNRIGDAVKNAVQISMKDERLKADLITNVSHDIKTPLTSIINYVDLLKRENIQDEKAQEYIRILDEKSQRLKQLTLDLVEASKISSGNITIEMSDIDVTELIKQAIGEYEDKISERKLQIITNCPENENVIVRADSRHMWRIFENLLLNVCKYALEGTRVYVDVIREEEMAVITLKNISAQPLNIPAEELTQRFIRGDVSRSTEGSGLGLSIAENLTTAQGGQFKIYLDGDLFKVVLRFPEK